VRESVRIAAEPDNACRRLWQRFQSGGHLPLVRVAKAQAQRNVAALGYARSNFNRGDELVKTGFLAKDNYDQRASTLGQSEASVAMDSAAVRSAEINLAYTEIRAPFSGRLGRNRAPVGTLVGGSGFTLSTLVQLDPLYVTFNPSERDLGVIQTARSAREVVAKVSLPDDASADYPGELTFIDNGVDRATGTITARATYPIRSSRFFRANTSAYACTSATSPTPASWRLPWRRRSRAAGFISSSSRLTIRKRGVFWLTSWRSGCR
jgi:RND family efflux transporter MFP subunit